MQTLGILEPTDVIDAILAGIVRNMQTDTPVDTYHKHTHVITHTDTGAYRQLPENLSTSNLPSGLYPWLRKVHTLPASRKRAP